MGIKINEDSFSTFEEWWNMTAWSQQDNAEELKRVAREAIRLALGNLEYKIKLLNKLYQEAE